jgi:crotonobetainyl-CoA:carnitine CoA-transferase CaiB-like acyl-CoA transferase
MSSLIRSLKRARQSTGSSARRSGNPQRRLSRQAIGTPADYRYQPPKTGEQSRELLGEWLGLSGTELDALETNGVIKQA